MLKTFYMLLAASLFVCPPLEAEDMEAPPASSPDPIPSPADALLDAVLLRLPPDPLQISGEYRADPREGNPERRGRVQLVLEYGATPPRARYTFMNLFGGEVEQMTIVRPAGTPPRWHYARGYPLADAPTPDPTEVIQGTDVTWFDISLSFLWWRPAVLIGEETILDRPCFIVEAMPSPGERSPYAKVRLWIDRQHLFLLRAEGYGPEEIPLRRLSVKSIMKMDGEWMVKDLDATSLKERLRTSLRMEAVDKPQGAVLRP